MIVQVPRLAWHTPPRVLSAWEARLGDCRAVLDTMPADSIDTVITDPPYGLSFMGHGWDHGVPDADCWRRVLRVMKPGAMLLAFGGTRMFHRLACAIEDAGLEIRDCLMWLHGQGFPKGQDIGKKTGHAEWDGWRTALKPAWEPVILAMKPCEGTFMDNALRHGVVGLALDAARIKPAQRDDYGRTAARADGLRSASRRIFGSLDAVVQATSVKGRYPANLILDEEAAQALDEQSAPRMHGAGHRRAGAVNGQFTQYEATSWQMQRSTGDMHRFGDSGGASRFFYTAKAAKSERGAGNHHPTVKPIALMEYLCRLTATPTGGTVLDPFMGSGSTGVAALRVGRSFIGIELEPAYHAIAEGRLAAV